MEVQHYMKICRFFTIDIFEMKIVKIILSLVKMGLSPLILLQGYLFLQKFELNYFVQYGPLYFIMLYAWVCIFCQSYTANIFTTYYNEFEIWKIDEATQEVKEKAKQTWFFIMLYIFVTILFSFVLSLSYMIPTSNDKELIWICNLANVYLPQWETSFVLIARCLLFVLAYMSHYLQNVNVRYAKIEYIPPSNLEYHQEINKQLLLCVQRHIQFSDNCRKALRLWEVYVLPYQVIGTICMASIVVYCFAFQGSLSGQYFRIATLAIITSTVLFGFATSGQGIENLSQEISDVLTEVDWYHWNQSNKQIYLIFLMNSAKMFRIKYSENISLNYKLGLQVVKAVFSAISIIHNLQRKNVYS